MATITHPGPISTQVPAAIRSNGTAQVSRKRDYDTMNGTLEHGLPPMHNNGHAQPLANERVTFSLLVRPSSLGIHQKLGPGDLMFYLADSANHVREPQRLHTIIGLQELQAICVLSSALDYLRKTATTAQQQKMYEQRFSRLVNMFVSSPAELIAKYRFLGMYYSDATTEHGTLSQQLAGQQRLIGGACRGQCQVPNYWGAPANGDTLYIVAKWTYDVADTLPALEGGVEMGADIITAVRTNGYIRLFPVAVSGYGFVLGVPGATKITNPIGAPNRQGEVPLPFTDNTTGQRRVPRQVAVMVPGIGNVVLQPGRDIPAKVPGGNAIEDYAYSTHPTAIHNVAHPHAVQAMQNNNYHAATTSIGVRNGSMYYMYQVGAHPMPPTEEIPTIDEEGAMYRVGTCFSAAGKYSDIRSIAAGLGSREAAAVLPRLDVLLT